MAVVMLSCGLLSMFTWIKKLEIVLVSQKFLLEEKRSRQRGAEIWCWAKKTKLTLCCPEAKGASVRTDKGHVPGDCLRHFRRDLWLCDLVLQSCRFCQHVLGLGLKLKLWCALEQARACWWLCLLLVLYFHLLFATALAYFLCWWPP